MRTAKIIGGVVLGAVILIIAAVYALPHLNEDQPTAQEKREHCLYAAIDQYPQIKLKAGEPIYGKVAECKGLPDADKVIVRDMMVGFIESAFTSVGN